MQAWQRHDLLSRATYAMDQLQDVLRQRREAREPVEALDVFAPELQRLFVAAEREALGRALSRCDRDVPTSEVAGARSHRVLRCATPSTRAAGPVRVARSLYRRPPSGPALGPLERRTGLIEGSWPPWAATQAPWGVAHVTPQEGEDLFELWGTMTPSQSPLDRWPKALRGHWEAPRPHCEAPLRPQEAIPDAAVALVVALAGVLAPRQEGQRPAQRQPARAQGPAPSGPAGSQEVGWATVSYDDRYGARLCTRRLARMPAGNTATLKSQVTAAVMGAWVRRPAVRGLKVAAGAPDHWSSLAETLPGGAAVLECYHAATPLGEALGAA
jgi:hypothetical protein